MSSYEDLLYPLGDGVTALVVMAADLEYGAHLRKLGIKPLFTGLGPVHAAIALTHALAELTRGGRMPDLIINIGSAGSATLQQGVVYRVSHCSYRDMDASALGFAKGQTPFSPHPPEIEAAAVLPGFPSASCSTGADVISDHSATGADMVDMEYFALNEVAMRFAVPLMGLKGVSDGQKPLTGELTEWTELLPLIDQNLAAAISDLKRRFAERLMTKEHLRMPLHWKREHATLATHRAGRDSPVGPAQSRDPRKSE